jgi:hypothetical protein
MGLCFEWDERKSDANLKRHGVTFREAATVLADPLSITISDSDHSVSEKRFIDIGLSYRERLLVVSYTERGDRIRLISARRATRSERKQYEEAK